MQKDKKSEIYKESLKIALPSGDEFEGETKNGKRNGKGKHILLREDIFVNRKKVEGIKINGK